MFSFLDFYDVLGMIGKESPNAPAETPESECQTPAAMAFIRTWPGDRCLSSMSLRTKGLLVDSKMVAL